MAEANGSKLRFALDAGIIVTLFGLAFSAGVLFQQVADLREAVNTRGRVQISIEAATRLSEVETSDYRQDMRLEAIEDELRRRAYQ